ncbi:hypothetical protein ACIQWR_32945 [Streptomyces sp. NPDC098789]|uniref:hypothetical protein n=1 Tax=Streptomyces sp. NPDC098789 TaxID=3366098 RepID=UPI00381C73CB
MKNIARLIATAALAAAALLTAGGIANADGGDGIGWPVAPPTGVTAVADGGSENIGWPVAPPTTPAPTTPAPTPAPTTNIGWP